MVISIFFRYRGIVDQEEVKEAVYDIHFMMVNFFSSLARGRMCVGVSPYE